MQWLVLSNQFIFWHFFLMSLLANGNQEIAAGKSIAVGRKEKRKMLAKANKGSKEAEGKEIKTP